jgi:sulfur-carrier protein adenylyltransferase/sulfurtransferase
VVANTDFIEPAELAALLATSQAQVLVVDVRSVAECLSEGILERSLRSSMETALQDVARESPKPRAIVFVCATGKRSEAVTSRAKQAGHPARSLAGGFRAWKDAGLPWTRMPLQSSLTTAQIERYARHLRLSEVGLAGQEKMCTASILCVGAGGLGSPVVLYLAAAGIGHIGIVDDDVVDLSNLQRQVAHERARWHAES